MPIDLTNEELIQKYGKPDDVLEYKGFTVYFWNDDYGQQMFTYWEGEEIGLGCYNFCYKEDMQYLIDKKIGDWKPDPTIYRIKEK